MFASFILHHTVVIQIILSSQTLAGYLTLTCVCERIDWTGKKYTHPVLMSVLVPDAYDYQVNNVLMQVLGQVLQLYKITIAASTRQIWIAVNAS